MTEPKTCQGCGAALDTDQRYCLNCGRRRGGPRVDFRKHVGERPQPEPAVVPASPVPEGKPQRDYTPLAAAGGIAVLGIMLLIGVLIGRGEGDSPAPAPTQVLTVPADGAGEGATASGGEGGGGALGGATGGKEAKAKGAGKGKGGSEAVKAPPPEITASDAELEALEAQSPQEYSESSAKLPDEIATPGAAPPTDNKAPGGGSGGATIE